MKENHLRYCMHRQNNFEKEHL